MKDNDVQETGNKGNELCACCILSSPSLSKFVTREGELRKNLI
jgi:hypothetical protein